MHKNNSGICLPSEYTEVNAQDMENIVGGGWTKEVCAFFGAFAGGLSGAMSAIKDINSITTKNVFCMAVITVAHIFTGFMKGFADCRKSGAELESSASEIKSLSTQSLISLT